MTKAKIAITVSRSVLAKAKRAVKEGRAASVSAFFEEAVEPKDKKRITRDQMLAIIDDILAENGGPMTEAERREAEGALGLVPKRKRRRAA